MIEEYSKELLKRFKSPKFSGSIKNPDTVSEVGNPACGDIMHMELKIKDGVIKDIKFKTLGCPAAIASSDVVCELAKGKTLKQAKKITPKDVLKKLKKVPQIKVHCSFLGISALKKAIENYEKNAGKL